MTKRIVSGVFLLIALGALGLILAGALTSGEQLIVRFLTAIIVAALGLYVISDLRLQADDNAAAAGSRTTMTAPRITTGDQPPPNSTAAFMATVTGKRAGTTADLDATNWDGLPDDTAGAGTRSAGEPTLELMRRVQPPSLIDQILVTDDEVGDDEARDDVINGDDDDPLERTDQASSGAPLFSGISDDESPYSSDIDDATAWPFNSEPTEPALTSAFDTDQAENDDDDLIAIFARKTEQELSERENVLSMAGAAGASAGHDNVPGPTSMLPGTEPGSSSASIANGDGVGDFLRQAQPLDNGSTRGASGNGHPLGAAFEDGNGNGFGGLDEHDESEDAIGSDHEDDADELGHLTETPTTNSGDKNPFRADTADGIHTTTFGEVGPHKHQAVVEPSQQLEAASYADESIAPIIDLRLAQATAMSDDIDAAIHSGEIEVISSLIDQGVLTTAGPISDRDVRTMVYVAFTSSELRKILLAGGTVDGDNSNLDLGDVEVFPQALHYQPKALGSGVTSTVDARDDYEPGSQAL